MHVEVDNIWASPSTLHVRVLVYVGANNHRRKFYASVPLKDIPSEALRSVIISASDEPDPNEGMMPLPGL